MAGLNHNELTDRVEGVILPAFISEGLSPTRTIVDAYCADGRGTQRREQAIGFCASEECVQLTIVDTNIIGEEDPIVDLIGDESIPWGVRAVLYDSYHLDPSSLVVPKGFLPPGITFSLDKDWCVTARRTRVNMIGTNANIYSGGYKDLRTAFGRVLKVKKRNAPLGDYETKIRQRLIELYTTICRSNEDTILMGDGSFTAPIRKRQDFYNLHRIARREGLGRIAIDLPS